MKQAAALAGVIVLASCAPVDEPRQSLETIAAVEPAVKVTGEAKSCLSASSIQNTSVRGDGVIDFTVTGGKVYRNYLASGCSVLRKNDSITYEVKGGTLCSGEIVYELDNYASGFQRGPACGLGDFIPVEYAD
tara:strand:- start:4394 stop:4792 length:399 start_codon:yes stop_codon:yes gene_type:complete